MNKARSLQLIQNFLDPRATRPLTDKELHQIAQELSAITGHPAPTNVIFHTFFDEDLEDGLTITPEFLLDYMVRTADRFKRYGG